MRITDGKPGSDGFAQRLADACGRHPAIPRSHGRQAWVRRGLEERFGDRVSPETVRKWFSGDAKPAGDRMPRLAELLGVNNAWLAWGQEGAAGERASGVSEESEAADFSVPPGVLKLQRLRERLGGTVKVAPGVDLTEPVGEPWEADT